MPKLLQNNQHYPHKRHLQPLHTLNGQRKCHCYPHHQHQQDNLTTKTTIDNSFQDHHHPDTIEIKLLQDHHSSNTTDLTSNTFQDHSTISRYHYCHYHHTRFQHFQDHTNMHQDTLTQQVLTYIPVFLPYPNHLISSLLYMYAV